MKIVNIDAPKDVVRKIATENVLQFIRETFRNTENELDILSAIDFECGPFDFRLKKTLPLYPIRMFPYRGCLEIIANLLHTIPVYLREERPLECGEKDIVDMLGAYYPSRNGNSPHIELYVTAIDQETTGDNEKFKWLFTKVLIHELAHAALDLFNYEIGRTITESVQYSTEFGKWREESMANAIALHVIHKSGNQPFYDYAKDFMLNQDEEYALGAKMGDLGYWDYRHFMDSKEDGVNQKLQDEWLTYVKGNPDADGLRRWNERLAHNI